MGHLRVGARADIVLYDLLPETAGEEMLSALSDCWCMIKDGVLVRQGGAFTGLEPPRITRCREIDEDVSGLAQTDLFQNATLRFENLRPYPHEQGHAGGLEQKRS
jgi:formylmethanofuran dehydrogenase subunit A